MTRLVVMSRVVGRTPSRWIPSLAYFSNNNSYSIRVTTQFVLHRWHLVVVLPRVQVLLRACLSRLRWDVLRRYRHLRCFLLDSSLLRENFTYDCAVDLRRLSFLLIALLVARAFCGDLLPITLIRLWKKDQIFCWVFPFVAHHARALISILFFQLDHSICISALKDFLRVSLFAQIVLIATLRQL